MSWAKASVRKLSGSNPSWVSDCVLSVSDADVVSVSTVLELSLPPHATNVRISNAAPSKYPVSFLFI